MKPSLSFTPALSTLLLAGLAPTIVAQGSINKGNVDYAINNIPDGIASDDGDATFTAHRAAQSNILPLHWWYYRVQGDPQEYPFNTGDTNNDGSNTQGFTENYIGDTAILNWQDVDERGQLSATMTIRLHSTGSHHGLAVTRMRMQNISNQPLSLNMFSYVDFDVCSNQNSATGDANGNRHHIVEANCNVFAEYYAVGMDHYEAAAWRNLQGKLLDAAADDLRDVGLPWSPGDYTAAFQWQNRQLLPGESKTFIDVLSYRHSPCNDEASSVNYGVAGPGSNGIPIIQTTGMPIIRETAQVRVTNALPNQGGTVLFGFGRTNIVLANLTLLTNPIADAPIAFDGSGTGTVSLTVPRDYSLCGVNVNVQCFFVDPGAGPFPLAHTDGIEWTVSDY